MTNTKHVNSYHEQLDEKGLYNPIWIIPGVIKRFSSELVDLTQSFKKNFSQIFLTITRLFSVRSVEDINKLNDLTTDDNDDEEYDITYGYKKIIIVVTKEKRVLALDSRKKFVLWSTYSLSRELEADAKLVGLFSLADRHGENIDTSIIIVYHSISQSKLLIYKTNPSKGDIKIAGTIPMKSVLSVF